MKGKQDRKLRQYNVRIGGAAMLLIAAFYAGAYLPVRALVTDPTAAWPFGFVRLVVVVAAGWIAAGWLIRGRRIAEHGEDDG